MRFILGGFALAFGGNYFLEDKLTDARYPHLREFKDKKPISKSD